MGEYAGAGDTSVCGFQPHDAAQTRRHPDGPTGIRSHRHEAQARGYSGSGAAGRDSWVAPYVPRIPDRREVHSPGGLAHGGLAEQDGTRVPQTLPRGRVLIRYPAGEDLRAVACGNAPGVVVVLEGDGDAVQRPAVTAALDLVFGGLRFL